VLTPILPNDDPYEAAAVFVNAEWSLVFQTPPESGDPHRRHAESVTELAVQPWGEQAFHAVVSGYRFLIAAGG
jgi:hypothetical protein